MQSLFNINYQKTARLNKDLIISLTFLTKSTDSSLFSSLNLGHDGKETFLLWPQCAFLHAPYPREISCKAFETHLSSFSASSALRFGMVFYATEGLSSTICAAMCYGHVYFVTTVYTVIFVTCEQLLIL